MSLVERGHNYALEIVNKKIPACRWIVLACQRYLDDLEKEDAANYPYFFDEITAEKKLRLIERLPHVKGEWAYKRQLITLAPWQCFFVMNIYGWKKKSNGYRRFREAVGIIPRKNGKSVLGAGIGIIGFLADGEHGAEIYSGAGSLKQALEVFRPARLMLLKSPDLMSVAGVVVGKENLNRPVDGSRFEPLIGNPGDGASPSVAIVDEYHEHLSSALYDTMITGMGARNQPITLIISTAGNDVGGPCRDKQKEVEEMLEGICVNDELFGMVYTIDDGDDWTKPETLLKANPNFGVSINAEYLISQQQRAINNARFANTFKTKHLNVWVSSKTAFFNMEKWKEAEDKTLCLEDFAGHDCVLGLDLARKLDLTAMARLFIREIEGRKHYYSIAPKFWVPDDTVLHSDNRRQSENYQRWVNSGELTSTPGAEVDYREIFHEVEESAKINPILFVPMDPHGAANLGHQISDEGLEVVNITQNFSNMSDPMKELEAAINSGRFHHDGNAIMTWCVSNVVGVHLAGNDDVVRPAKEKSNRDSKIDGAVALIMSIKMFMQEIETEVDSVYENDGLLVL